MTTLDTITVKWQEDGSATALARVCSRDATGAATGTLGEGNYIKQADLTSIGCKVFDRNSTTPDTAIATPTVTIATSILDTPDTSGLTAVDDAGNAMVVNFRHDLAGTNFPTGGHKYRVEYSFLTTGAATWVIAYEGIASPVVGS